MESRVKIRGLSLGKKEKLLLILDIIQYLGQVDVCLMIVLDNHFLFFKLRYH